MPQGIINAAEHIVLPLGLGTERAFGLLNGDLWPEHPRDKIFKITILRREIV